MRIGIDARILHETIDGAGRLVLGLLSQLHRFPDHEFVIIHNGYLTERLPHSNISYMQSSWSVSSGSGMLFSCRDINRLNLDVLYFPFYSVPLFVNCRICMVCHDLYFLRNKNYFSGMKRWLWPLIALVARHRLRRADTVIAVSRTTFDQVVREAPSIPRSHINIVPNFCHFNKKIPGYTEIKISEKIYGDPYILYVGNNRNHKNLSILVMAFARARSKFKNMRLIMAGRIEKKYTDPHVYFKENSLDGKVAEHLGPVTDQALIRLYEGAKFVAIPSLYEGFGIPAIEAGLHSKAVLCSDIAAFREVMGDSAILLSPHDVDSWEDAIVTLMANDDLRTTLAAKARARSDLYTVEAFADRTIAALEKTS